LDEATKAIILGIKQPGEQRKVHFADSQDETSTDTMEFETDSPSSDSDAHGEDSVSDETAIVDHLVNKAQQQKKAPARGTNSQ
jgi:hypothetical protein